MTDRRPCSSRVPGSFVLREIDGLAAKTQDYGKHQKGVVVDTAFEDESRSPRRGLVAAEAQRRIPIVDPSEC